jgi:hypothetical protein
MTALMIVHDLPWLAVPPDPRGWIGQPGSFKDGHTDRKFDKRSFEDLRGRAADNA